MTSCIIIIINGFITSICSLAAISLSFSALTPYRSSYQFISVNLADVGAAINPSAPEMSPAAVGERAAEPPIRLR
jgi:hypothetical protein